MKSSDGTFFEKKKCKWNAYVIKHPAYDVAMILTLKWPRGGPRDPRFIFRAFNYFRLRFLHSYFF